jgi:hypothetical protein
MSHPVFPTITKLPSAIKWTPENKGISSQMTDGFEISRARFTKTRFAAIEVEYTALSYADYEAIMDFYTEKVYGEAVVFEWTCNDPQSKYYNRVFEVRMSEPDFERISPGFWSGSVTFRGELKNV